MIFTTLAISLIMCANRVTLAAVALGKAQEHPNHPGHCYDPSSKVPKTVGEKWPLKNECGRIMCEEIGNSLYLSYSTCPSIGLGDPSCIIVSGDHQSPYPNCCPTIQCPSENILNDDQLMMATQPETIATYDVAIDDQDYSDSFEDYSDSFDAMFSDVFPLWRDDIGEDSNLQINDEENRPKLFIPRK